MPEDNQQEHYAKQQQKMSFVENVIVCLRNGQIVRGRLKEQTDKAVVLEMIMGDSIGTISFHKKKIKTLERLDK